MSQATEAKSLEELSVDAIRVLSMDAVQAANSGHPGTPMALAPLTYVLYTKVMKHAPHTPEWPDRDRFVLSAGHASMLLYSTLHLTGYGITLDEIKNFRQVSSPLAGHPEYGHAPGIETTTGPLGQGIATAVGMALAERLLAARFNTGDHTIVDHYTYVIASDGDMEEGVQSEGASLAGHLGLGKLIAFYDDNHISIEGDTSVAFSEDVGKRYEAYGWDVVNLHEDISLEALETALDNAKAVTDKPSLIIVRSHIGYGAPTLQDTGKAHGSPLGEKEINGAKEFYGYPSLEPFYVPPEVTQHYASIPDRGQEFVRAWETAFAAYKEAEPDKASEFERLQQRATPQGWDADVPTKPADAKGQATRKSSEDAIQWVAANVPELIGGSADLAGSTLTLIAGADSVGTGAFSGRNMHFGIREHGMGACVNGMTLHNLRGYGATFLQFYDYMRASVRLAALMQVPSIFVYTHDSIGLGEDGPTHQPIEQLASGRAVPNLNVIRPADYNETVRAWQYAINSTKTPSVLVFSRQGVPTIDPALVPADAIARGAYVLDEASSGTPQVILMATGTEVAIARDARELLEAEGIATRVVSMPCIDTFAEQDQAYRDSILLPDVKARVAVEAASSFGWHRWIGEGGDFVGMDGFGKSGPAKELYELFGITAEAVARRAKVLI